MNEVNSSTKDLDSAVSDEGLRAHMAQIYRMMSIGMLITFAAAWAIAGYATTSIAGPSFVEIGPDLHLTDLGQTLYLSPLKWLIMLGPLLFIILGGTYLRHLSAPALQLAFYTFATMMGLSLSSIFLIYTGHSIVQVFLVTSIAFAGLSLWGYTTKKDISGWGSFLLMGVIGIIAAAILNIFMASGAISFAVSIIAVFIFAGLTAYDTQRIKTEYVSYVGRTSATNLQKMGTMDALTLYLNFINLFIHLLSLTGSRN